MRSARDGWVRPRVARPAGARWNALKTLAQTVVMWSVFLWLLPWAVYELEEWSGFAGWRVEADWLRWVGIATFVVGGLWGLRLGNRMAVLGRGTPLPLDTARELVVVGSYAYVRNPMALASFTQGFAVAAYLGSPTVALYVVCGMVLWNYIARPWEERDLVERFGEPYEHYRLSVPCWVFRTTPYVPPALVTPSPSASPTTSDPPA